MLGRFFYAVALPLLLAAIVFALRVMPARGTSWLVHLDVGLAWFSALSAMVLVPTDVSTTLEAGLFASRHHFAMKRWSAYILRKTCSEVCKF